MAGRSRPNKMVKEIIQVVFLWNVFYTIIPCKATVESHGQAFIQTDNELRYMVDGHIDGVPNVLQGENIQDGLSDGNLPSSPIRFEPPILDFRDQPVGMPQMQHVTVHNPDTHDSLHLLSISGSTLHFHCSFFQDKRVPPGGNTTFDVVFLARQIGSVENTLYIHTSQGSFKYQVIGIGVANPYRIRPFLGARMPLNSSYSPLIHMHNPHTSTLQVIEMYSSGGDLHLELPTGEKEAPRNFWEIPPFETKPVMRANFIGRAEMNHTAFIRIRTNRDQNEILVLPVEVEVTSSPGIFSPLEMLDFGILRTVDGPKTLRLNLFNSGSKAILVTSVAVTPPNDAINVEFRGPVKLPSDVLQATPVAFISFTAQKAIHPKQFSGKIVVRARNANMKLVIPYQANVLHGTLHFNKTKTRFFTGSPPHQNETRKIPVTNTFNMTIVVYNITTPHDVSNLFTVENFTSPVVLRAHEVLQTMYLKFHPNASNLHLITELQLHTNASIFNIPVVVYNGRLKVVHHRPEIFKGQLDFGTLGVEEKRSMTFTLRNDNPLDIVIKEFGANMEKTKVHLLGVEKGNGTTLTRQHDPSKIETHPLVLKPHSFAVFSVNLTAPNYEGTFAAEVIIVTQYENLYIPITLRTAEGSLNAVPEKLVFEKTYPGKVPSQELKIHSSFDNYMEVRDVSFQPNDSRFIYEAPKTKPVLLHPNSDVIIGQIHFDAKRECKEDCYLGLPTSIPAGHQWLLGLALDKEVADTDQYLYTRFQQKWQQLAYQQQSTINVTIQLDTNQVRGFLFPAQAHLHWPSMINRGSKIRFPLTQIGNVSMSDFIIENPSDTVIIMQVVTLALYPNPQIIVDLLSEKVGSFMVHETEMDDPDVFFIPDTAVHNKKPDSAAAKFSGAIESLLGVQPHKDSIAMMIGANQKVRIRAAFQPKDDFFKSSLILIRNNLTILDAIILQGQGGQGDIRFSNRRPGSTTPLLFELTEKHLKACDTKAKNKQKGASPTFTVRRTFTVRNTGQLPFYVHGFSINDIPCEGYGFKILDCSGFQMLPNDSKKIDIAFTPDFTMSRIRRSLTVDSSLGIPINYTLQATIPSFMLSKCAAALPRPPWEPILYYSTLCLMGFLLFCIMVASYFEADRHFTADILKRRARSSLSFDKTKVFDLNQIATGVRADTSAHTSTGAPNGKPASLQRSTSTTQETESNGHVPPTRKKSESALSSIFILRLMKNLFSRWTTHRDTAASSRKSPDRQGSVEKEISKTSSSTTTAPHNTKQHTMTDTIKSGMTPEGTLVSDNKINPYAVGKTYRNKKMAKQQQQQQQRQQNDLISDVNTNAAIEKKQGNKQNSTLTTNNNVIQRKLSSDNSEQKEKATSAPSASHRRSAGMDSPDNDATTKTTDNNATQPKPSTKKGKKKSQAVVKEERKNKDELRKQELADNDETSSTTTESSSAEVDEKVSSARESTPEPVTASKKKKGRKDKKKNENHADDDEEFIIISKSKAHKDIKVDPKSAYGGDMYCPSSLDLPYTMDVPSKDDSEVKNDKGNDDKPSKKKKNKNKGEVTMLRTRSDTESSDTRGGNSPPPAWDTPVPLSEPSSIDDNFSELASQTEKFAKLNKNNGRGASPDTLSTNSRSSSYSSVVSNGAGNAAPGAEQRGNARQTIPRLALNVESKKNAYEPKHPGTIGSRATLSPMPDTGAAPGGSTLSNLWNLSPASPVTPAVPGFGAVDGLTGLKEEELLKNLGTPDFSGTVMADPMVNVAQYPASPGFEQPVTMMQRLQAERRKRLVDYHQKVIKGEQWPGFDIPVVSQESLWDPTNTTGVAPMPPAPEPWQAVGSTPSTGGLWDTPPLSNGSSGGWNPVSSIWSTGSPTPATTSISPSPEIMDGAGAVVTDGTTGSASPGMAGFDPFNTLGSIWKPTATDNGSSGWGFPPKPDEEPN